MKVDYKTHYDGAYWSGSKQYKENDGSTGLYQGPSLDWEGFDTIWACLDPLLVGDSIIDIGCGGGGLTARMVRGGRDAHGIEISDYAIKNCVPDMRGRITKADISKKPDLGTHYDTLISTDLLEHIYEEDLDETFEWMKSVCRQEMFFLVATANAKEEFILKKGATVPEGWEATAISGHVNVRSWTYWVKFFRRHGMKIRYDLIWRLQAYRDHVEWWRNMPQWGGDCTYFLEF